MQLFKSLLLETIEDESGIALKPDDLKIELEEGQLLIQVWEETLLELEEINPEQLNEEDSARELTEIVMEEFYDIRESLIELRLLSLNNAVLPAIREEIFELFQKKNIPAKVLNVADLEFIDISTPDKDSGLPTVALRFTDYEQFECQINYPITTGMLNTNAADLGEKLLAKLR